MRMPPPPHDNGTTLASYNLNKASWDNIQESLGSLDWRTIFSNKDSGEQQATLMDHVSTIVQANCRKYACRPGQSRNLIPRDRRILFRQRKRKLQKRNSPTTGDRQRALLDNEIQEIEKKLIASFKREKLAEEERAINNIKTNPKHFYSYARKHLVLKGGIGPLKVDDNLITAPQAISESLSAQYSSAFTRPDPINAIGDPVAFFTIDNTNLPALLNIDFNEQMIKDEIDNLNNNSAPGPDHFPVLLLKKCKKELSKPIYLFWRHSLDHGDIASIYRHAVICPALKSNSESYLPKSYRPISLTSHLIKIFEKIMRAAIVKHLHDNNLLPINQHGFLQGKSTLSQLISQVETITRVLESGCAVDTIYLDFAKAFDKVDHAILCRKLKAARIGGNVGIWLHTFLTNRTQQVSANGAISSPSPVLSGVPQGTVLGPILFTIMINDLDANLVRSFASLFADDTRVSSIISSDDDAQAFQDELSDIIYPWAPENKAQFNGDKFEHIHFGKEPDVPHIYNDPGGNPINAKPLLKDLGIWISNDLCWSHQIDRVISSSRQKIAWILRTFAKRDKLTMRTLWMSLVRPIVDYCSPLWSPKPTNYGNIDRIESILRGFTKHVDGLENLDYNARLKALNLQSIQRRHERYKIIYTYKIKVGLVPNLPLDPSDPTKSFALVFTDSLRGGCQCNIPNLIRHHNPAQIQRNSSFALTARDLWNCLPPWLSSISNLSVTKFKNCLDKFLDLFPDEPRCSASGLYVDVNTFRVSNSIIHILSNASTSPNIPTPNNMLTITGNLAGEGLNEVIPHP